MWHRRHLYKPQGGSEHDTTRMLIGRQGQRPDVDRFVRLDVTYTCTYDLLYWRRLHRTTIEPQSTVEQLGAIPHSPQRAAIVHMHSRAQVIT